MKQCRILEPIVFTLLLFAQPPNLLSAQEERQSSPSPYYTLVSQGTSLCTLVTAERPTPAARLAALELQHHLHKISGAKVPIRSETQSVEGLRILVGESEATRQFRLKSSDLPPQEYLIAFRPNTIVLLGRDWEDTESNRRVQGRSTTDESLTQSRHKIDYGKAVGASERILGEIELPGVYDDQGTCLATYDFLERFCGVRWYGPSEIHIIAPQHSTIRIEGQDVRRTPALKHRSALVSGSWPFLRSQWGEFTRDQLCLFWRRNRQGGERWAGNHTFHRKTIEEVFTDPAYQCQNPKGRGSQLCYSNAKLVDQVTQMARNYFDGKGELPDGWKASGNYFSIVPDDNVNLCQCPNCRALLERGQTRRTGFFSSGEMSDYWFSFVNAVAREVRQTHPDKFISTLAYWRYALPPSFDLEPNVSVAPCLHTCYYPVHPEMRENDLSLYRQWQAKTKAPTFLWVYYHHPMEAALIGKWKCFPHVMIHSTTRAMQQFLKDGVQGIFECGEQDQLEQYVMTKIWDDPEIDVDHLINEFFQLYFGKASEPMRQFYLALESIACNPSNYPAPYHRSDGIDWKKAAWEQLGTEDRMRDLATLVEQAEKLAQPGKEKQRVGLWRKAFWDWMSEGQKQHSAAGVTKGP